MKSPVSPINTYSIADMNFIADKQGSTNDFFVFRKSELPTQEGMFRPARTSHFTIFLHLRGELEVKVNLITYKVSHPCLFILPPGSVREKVKESADCDAITVGFTPDFMSKQMMHKKHIDAFQFFASQSEPDISLSVEEADTIFELARNLKKIKGYSEHQFKEELIYHSFNLFMFELGGIVNKKRPVDRIRLTRKEDLLIGFIRLLAIHFKEERSVQFYADALFITPKHLTKTVKELTNKTCGELINEMVITEAKILLGDISNSVSGVADQLHFSDQFFFFKLFKNNTGLSPKAYKSIV